MRALWKQARQWWRYQQARQNTVWWAGEMA
jgi:hypothetical protein